MWIGILMMYKRMFDLTLTVLALIVLFPLLFWVAVLIRVNLGSPIFFQQKRPGLNGKPFLIYKYRTMSDEKDENNVLLPDEQRLNTVGRFLRSTSFDELPELFNIIKGDMSIVGPRPLLMKYLDRYTPDQAKRHEVKPGLTGWAQINGRNSISWEEKFTLDVWYVENQSIWLDIKIFLMTIIKVFKREGINEPGKATMTEFIGTEPHT